MLRKTVAKAFGSGDPETAPVAPAAHLTRRSEAIDRIFAGLQEAFRAALPEESLPRADGGALDALTDEPRQTGQLTLGRLRPRPGGVELTLEGPAGAFTFVNSMAGFITVFAGESAADGLVLEVLGAQLQGGTFRPIRKPLDPAIHAGVLTGSRRLSFRFTSVPEVAREYLVRARSIQKVDTQGGLP